MTDENEPESRAPESESGSESNPGSESGPESSSGVERENNGSRFDRLPASLEDRSVTGRPTREEVVAWWTDRYGVPVEVFEGYTFWEKGSGKLWAFRGEAPSPIAIEGLGITFLRTRRDHWKPTTDAVQRFGHHATRNVCHVSEAEAKRFVAGEDQDIAWEGDWGYLIVAHELAGVVEPIGVGLYLYNELRSQVPKGRRRDLK